MTEQVIALVLAGTRPGGDPLAIQEGVAHKGLLDIGGTPMIARVLAALDAAPAVSAIWVATDQADLLKHITVRNKTVTSFAAAAGPSASVAAALARLPLPLLVTTADHALLRPEWVAEFLASGQRDAPEADALLAMARKHTVLAAVPDTQRTWLSLADDAYSGCNLFLLRTAAAGNVVKLWQQLEADRKRPLSLLRRLGVGALLRYLLGRLTLRHALQRLGRISGARLAAVTLSDGRAAIDVDKPSDLVLVRKLIARDM